MSDERGSFSFVDSHTAGNSPFAMDQWSKYL